MKKLDITKFPVANKQIERFRKCNVKNILELEFKENSFKANSDFDFDFLKLEGFNRIFYLNETIKEKNLMDNISLDENKIIINKDCKHPLLVVNYYDDENVIFEKDLKYIIDNETDILIFEIFISSQKNNFIKQKREFSVDRLSNLEYIQLQKLSFEDFFNIEFKPTIHQESTMKFFNFNFGSQKAYNNFDINLDFPHSTFEMEGLTNISQKQEVANIVNTIHNGKDTNSTINVNHILDGNSHGIFEVIARVNHGANNSNVIQSSKTTLLSDDAIINANPRLEIFIDELKASHGATTGSLDEDILYYLQSRGLSKKQASKMMLDAIENKILEKISNKTVVKFIKEI